MSTDYQFSRQEDIPFSRYQAQGAFDEFFQHYPEELVDSLYSMWIAGGMPFVKSYDEWENDPQRPLPKGGMRASYTHGSFKKGPMMWTDTLHVRENSMSDFLAEMAHGLQYYMDKLEKQDIKKEFYALLDTVGLPLSEWMRESQAYKDPNLKRNPNAKEFVAHRILEPWAKERWDIDRILDEWLNETEEGK